MEKEEKKEKLIQFVEQLFLETQYTYHKFIMHTYLHNKFVEFPNTQDISPSFFILTMDSLQNDAIIKCAKLFDKGRKSYGTIRNLLDSIEANIDLFGTEEPTIVKKLAEHRKVIEEHEQLLKNLFVWRDKHFAHPDKEYFLDEDRIKLADDATMKVGDLPDLLKKFSSIINFYYYKLKGELICYDDIQVTQDVDTLFDIFIEFKNNQ